MRLRPHRSKSPVVLNELALLPNNSGFIELFQYGGRSGQFEELTSSPTRQNLRKAQIKSDLFLPLRVWRRLGFRATRPHAEQFAHLILSTRRRYIVDAVAVSFLTIPARRRNQAAVKRVFVSRNQRAASPTRRRKARAAQVQRSPLTKSGWTGSNCIIRFLRRFRRGALFLHPSGTLRRKIPLSGKTARKALPVAVSLP